MVLVVLSHGRKNPNTGMGEVMSIDWKGVPIQYIKNSFNDGHKCLSMIGKPKLFIIQACRGNKWQDKTNIQPREPAVESDFYETDGDSDEEKELERDGVTYPMRSWYFVFNSTIKGYISGRDTEQGSIFIQALCKELNDKWNKHDLTQIASYVNRRIMNEHSIQAPEFINQLGDLVFFRKPT